MALKKILLRRDTRTNWDLNNPYLEEGEIGVILEGTNSTIKIGAYKELNFIVGMSCLKLLEQMGILKSISKKRKLLELLF